MSGHFTHAELLSAPAPCAPQVISQRGRFSILARSHEVALKDGSLTKLHHVIEGKHPEPARFLRAYLHPEAGTFIFDVSDLATCLQKDLRQCLPRDAAGHIQFELRPRFANFAALRVAIVEHALVSFRADLVGLAA